MSMPQITAYAPWRAAHSRREGMNRKVVAERLKAVLERKNWTVYELSKRVKSPGSRGLLL